MKYGILTALILCSLTLPLRAQVGDDRYEPNNSASSARSINLGRYDLSFTIGDEDWFSFRLSSPALIRVYTEGDLDTRLNLYGPDADPSEVGSREIDSDDDGGEENNARITTSLNENGLYYIRVWPYDDDSVGGYGLVLETVELKADALEPNNSRGQARSLSLSQLPLDLSIFPRDDSDWFKLDPSSFSYQEGEVISLYTTGELDTLIELYQGDAKILEDDDGAEDYNARINFLPERGISYYIRIQGYDNAVGEYSLHAETEIVELDPYEPNNTRERATKTSVGQTISGNALGDYDAIDWFSFSISQPGTYAIGTTGGLDTYIVLYNAAGGELYSDDDGGGRNNALIESYLEPGTYYAATSLVGNGDYGEYSFFVRRR
jgi:hypothetical protein